MSYQSEAELEQQLIEQLKGQDYSVVNIPDYTALVDNFKVQFILHIICFHYCQVLFHRLHTISYPLQLL